jgi:predicted TIM-barrel fold metal-dependent hydrolase
MAMSERSVRRELSSRCNCCALGIAVPDLGRRRFLTGGIAALGLGSFTAAPAALAQAPTAKTRIDVHHHFVPPFHAEVMATRRSGGRPPRWSVQMSLDEMDQSGIATAVVSLVQPASWFADDVPLSRQLQRSCNEFAAKMVQDRPGRFGQFATLSPVDVEHSLKEIEYSLDTLKADGVSVMTSYGDKYLGDPSFAPVFEELNRRKALVYVHPTTPACCANLVPGIPASAIEFATDSTRAIAQLVFGGTVAKNPDIRWIVSHSGGTLPFLIDRFTRLAQDRKLADPMPAFRKLYYELAQGNSPGQIAALLKMVPISQLLYGTDYPLRRSAEVNAGITDYGFSADDIRSIEREAALKLMPRLQGA